MAAESISEGSRWPHGRLGWCLRRRPCNCCRARRPLAPAAPASPRSAAPIRRWKRPLPRPRRCAGWHARRAGRTAPLLRSRQLIPSARDAAAMASPRQDRADPPLRAGLSREERSAKTTFPHLPAAGFPPHLPNRALHPTKARLDLGHLLDRQRAPGAPRACRAGLRG
jgi:hypothetical protein